MITNILQGSRRASAGRQIVDVVGNHDVGADLHWKGVEQIREVIVEEVVCKSQRYYYNLFCEYC